MNLKNAYAATNQMIRIIFSMSVRCIPILLFLMAAAGCANNGFKPVKTSDYLDFHKNHDLSFGWKINAGEHFTEVEGYIHNNCCFVKHDLELWVILLDPVGLEKERKVYYIVPISLDVDSAARFHVEFSNVIRLGDRIRFLYRYKSSDEHAESMAWMNSFEVEPLSPFQ